MAVCTLLSLFVLFGCTEKEKTTYNIPTVTTGNNTVYTESQSVTCNGTVTNDGGTIVTDRGICYMKGNSIPTLSNIKVSGGSGQGTFSCSFNVAAQGTYSYRAYATNSEGTAYGDVKTFTITSAQSASAIVRFGNDVWYDDTPKAKYDKYSNSHNWLSLYLSDNSLTKDASIAIVPYYEDEEIIRGSIVPTPANIWHGGGGPIYNIVSQYYTGPTYQWDYPYTEESFHSYFLCDIYVYYDIQNQYQGWIPKNFTINLININTTEKTCSITVEAAMIKKIDADDDADYSTNYINTAETRTLKIEAYNIPLEIKYW